MVHTPRAAFGSMKRLSLATEEAIAEIAGRAAARKVVAHLRGGASPDTGADAQS